MREIKFRAWNGEEVILHDSLYEFQRQNLSKKEFDKYTYLQFTGLLDKNGKEIYEGDVVRYENAGYDPSEGETPWEIGTVVFKNLAWMVDSDDYMLGDFSLTDLEVVGNIYENLELLK